MNISKLLKGRDCACGKRHICNIEKVVIEEGAKKLENAKWYAKDLKDRYSVLWMYYCLFYKTGM